MSQAPGQGSSQISQPRFRLASSAYIWYAAPTRRLVQASRRTLSSVAVQVSESGWCLPWPAVTHCMLGVYVVRRAFWWDSTSVSCGYRAGHDTGGASICGTDWRCHAGRLWAMRGACEIWQGVWLLHRPFCFLFFGEHPSRYHASPADGAQRTCLSVRVSGTLQAV